MIPGMARPIAMNTVESEIRKCWARAETAPETDQLHPAGSTITRAVTSAAAWNRSVGPP